LAIACPGPARAWGDEGHAIVALIAQHYLEPRASEQVQSLLVTDDSGLLADTSMASEALWADRYRDSDRDGARVRYQSTRQWHYVDIELRSPDLQRACHGHPALPAGILASRGPAAACIVDKIDQFETELIDTSTGLGERRVALQFLLHLIGDLHQPLHASDDADEGGNLKHVEANHWPSASLHHYWDVELVRALGPDPQAVAQMLIAHISARELRIWRKGGAADWALESHSLARRVAYGMLPRSGGPNRYYLNDVYLHVALDAVQLQLTRAGVRLAAVLNHSFP
jgi:hypothetical protein